MSRNPAGAVGSPALQRVRCFCRKRIFLLSRGRLLSVGGVVAALACALTVLAGPQSLHDKTDSHGVPVFTLDEAIQTAFQRNPAILTARQEIRRTRGVQIAVISQALPHLDSTAAFNYTAPSLEGGNGSIFGSTTGGSVTPTPSVIPTIPPTATPTATPTPQVHAEQHAQTTSTPVPSNGLSGFTTTPYSYNLRFTASQLLYNGSVIPSIHGAAIAHDSAIYSLRNTIDQVIATTRQQFYTVILNKALIGVQEKSVELLQSQLKDQQNRYQAGTVPRFNVLQASVALSNQLPALITARNNLRIAQLQLAKTIGLDFNPARGNGPPLECKGELSYEPRDMPLTVAIELGKERRPFLKQQRAAILEQIDAEREAYAGYQPSVSFAGGYAFESSEFSSALKDVTEGWFFGVTGEWAIFDGFETAGNVKAARALLSEAKITYDDAVRQVELEIQQAYSNLEQDRQLYQSQSQNVDEAREALRLATARLSVGAGVQLDVLNAQLALTQAASTRLQALAAYNSDEAEFDRVTATDTIYHDEFDDPMMRKHEATRIIKEFASPTPGARKIKPAAK